MSSLEFKDEVTQSQSWLNISRVGGKIYFLLSVEAGGDVELKLPIQYARYLSEKIAVLMDSSQQKVNSEQRRRVGQAPVEDEASTDRLIVSAGDKMFRLTCETANGEMLTVSVTPSIASQVSKLLGSEDI